MQVNNSKNCSEYRLIDILISVESGSRPKGGVNGVIDEIPSLGGEHIHNDGTIKFQNMKFVSRSFFNSMNRGIIQKNDVLVVKDGATTGKVAYVDENFPYIDASINEHIFICRSNLEIIFPKFLFFHIFSPRGQRQIAKSYHGSAQGGITFSFADEYKILLPPFPIQRQIVAVLEQAEALKRQRQEADALTGALLQSVFYEIFGDPVRNERGWETKKLKDISEIVSGVTKGRKFNGKPTIFVPYLRVANVQDGFLDLTEIKEIEVLESDIAKYQLKSGDVILTEGGDRDKLGRGHVWYEQIPLCLHQNHIFRVRLHEKFLNPEFFSYLIGSTYGKKYFAKSAKQTTGIASINSTQLKNFPVFLPPLALQQQFARVVSEVERIREQQEASGREIEGLFEGLTQRAFADGIL
jgi:type I restriction enzyme S subunit